MSADRTPETLTSVWLQQPTSGFRMVPSDFANRLRREVRSFRGWLAVGLLTIAVMAVLSGFKLVVEADPLRRAGLVLIGLAAGFFLAQVVVHLRRVRAVRFDAGRTTVPSLAAARAYLETRRAFHRGPWLWSRVIALCPGAPIVAWAELRAEPHAAWLMSAYVVGWGLLLALIVFGVQLREARRYDRQLRELDDIEQQSPFERFIAAHEQWR
jgi:hypothetical protein